jgi:signal transduction histidine kinase
LDVVPGGGVQDADVSGVPTVDRDAWRRGLAGWHVVFAVLAALAGVLIVGDDLSGPVERWTALGVLAALCGWYAAIGSRALRRESAGLGIVYLAVAAPLTVTVFALAGVGALMLVVLYPHMWRLLPTSRAVVGTVVVIAAVSGVIFARADFDGGGLVPALAYAGAGLLVAMAMGLWITRIIEQSRQRAELIAELAATRDELAAVSREAGVLAERARVARDIHDTLAQGFTSVLLQLEAAEAELTGNPETIRRHLAAAKRTTRANLAEARSLIGALTPPDLRAASLPEALGRLARRTGQEIGVDITLDVTGSPRAVPANHEVVLFRATQEALANVGKHAAAHTVHIGLSYADDTVRLRVRDDGAGFDPAAANGFGLTGMRSRVAEVGGTMTVDSTPGLGATLRIELPGGCP